VSGVVGVTAKTDPLITYRLPKELGALDRNCAARQRNDAVNMDVGIGKINRKSSIVVLNHGAQQQRPLAPEPEFVPGQKAGVVEIEPFGSGADDANVAIIIEDRESIAIFQGPQRSLDERALDFDIMPGQLYRRVRDAFYTSRPLMSVVADVRSPRKLRFAAIQPAAGSPLCECLPYGTGYAVGGLSPQPAGFKTGAPPCFANRSQASCEISRAAIGCMATSAISVVAVMGAKSERYAAT
jgi:hypothetical protein